LQWAFPLDIPMVPSSVTAVATDSERLTCGQFSLGETVHLGSFKFIVDYCGGLSLSPRRGDSGATFMGSTCSGTPPPWWAMIEDSTEEFLTASSREREFGLPSPRWHSIWAPPAPVTTTPWTENALATQALMTIPPRMAALRLDTGLPIEQCHTHHERQQARAHSW
jgi:hypothetical protein